MWLSLREQPVQNSWVGARHVDYLRPARLARHQRDGVAADTERRSDRGQGCRRRLAANGTGADPDDQRAVVLAAHARMAGPGPDLDGDQHDPSVPGPPTLEETGLVALGRLAKPHMPTLAIHG